MQSFIKNNCSKEWQSFINHHKSFHQVAAGETIFEEGQEVVGMHFIETGKAKVVTSTQDGNSRLIRLVTDGDILGHRGLAGDWKYPISCIALTSVKVCFLPIDIFNDLMKSNAQFTYAFSMFMAEELRLSEEKTGQLPVKYQVAKAILLNYQAFGFDESNTNTLSFTLSRKDIASKAGTTYESVIRVLSELNKKSIIKIINKDIVIPSLKKLKTFCEEYQNK